MEIDPERTTSVVIVATQCGIRRVRFQPTFCDRRTDSRYVWATRATERHLPTRQTPTPVSLDALTAVRLSTFSAITTATTHREIAASLTLIVYHVFDPMPYDDAFLVHYATAESLFGSLIRGVLIFVHFVSSEQRWRLSMSVF